MSLCDWSSDVCSSDLKEWSNYHTIALISHASKVMLKILQARLHQYVNHELSDEIGRASCRERV